MSTEFIQHHQYPSGTEEYPYRKVFGYARVSTPDQDMSLQIDALEKFGCDKIFQEKISAVAVNRKQFNKMMASIREGDVVVVWKLDRLGRQVVDIANLGKLFTDKNVELISLTQDINTTTPMGKVFFYLLAVFAEMERDMTIERTKAGMAIARRKGITFGQPTKVKGKKKISMLVDIWSLEKTILQIAKKHGYKSIATISNYFPHERRNALLAFDEGQKEYGLAFKTRLQEIASEQGISYDYIEAILKEQGIE